MPSKSAHDAIGFVGLGIMGSAMMRNVRRAGFNVIGYDIAPAALRQLEEIGGLAATSPREVAERTRFAITSLATEAAFREVMTGENGICRALPAGQIVVDTSTLSLEAKNSGCEALSRAGMVMLDCPVSGTGVHAEKRQISIFVSGDRASSDRCQKLFETFTRSQRFLGEFGNGTKMKFLANYLVNIHGAAAAEAMVLGVKAGLDPQLVYDTLCDSAATSRIFEARGPFMISGRYAPPTARVDMFLKDLSIIGDFARSLQSPSSLFVQAAQYYAAASANGLGSQDVATIYETIRAMAGIPPAAEPNAGPDHPRD